MGQCKEGLILFLRMMGENAMVMDDSMVSLLCACYVIHGINNNNNNNNINIASVPNELRSATLIKLFHCARFSAIDESFPNHSNLS
ncbi:hypothetical protein Sjap_014858 [Stephania japonica]|uniref:Uncharacterized protein n=1 Tax=Stephania japonica TaxID=461633 RepID=A0AAP0II23_9MAGN